MIQRIQTIYLFLAACAFALCFMFPIARYVAPIPSTQQTAQAELNLIPKDKPATHQELSEGLQVVSVPQRGFIKTWPLVVLIALCIAIAAGSIMLYSNRVLQARIVAVGFMLAVIYVFLVFIWAVDAYGKAFAAPYGAGDVAISWSVGTWAPVAGIVLLFLAQQAIKKDEAKVRAADRLR